MAALFSIGYVSSRYEHAMNRLNVHRTGLASTSMDAGELARRRDTLRAELMSYGESAPSAATILAELASICSASLVVDRFSISNGRFEVWAISSDALAELMTMETDLRFSEVTLKGIVPGSDGREGFSLTGKYND
jgi:hypothetical protein